MTYVEYMRRLGVSVEPEVKVEVVPTVEPVGISFRYQATLEGYTSRLPSRRTTDIQISQRVLPELIRFAGNVNLIEYYRRALLAVEAELESRTSEPGILHQDGVPW
jgi:hypothetical protein